MKTEKELIDRERYWRGHSKIFMDNSEPNIEFKSKADALRWVLGD
jgi:hypothetical protein